MKEGKGSFSSMTRSKKTRIKDRVDETIEKAVVGFALHKSFYGY
ncbi:hypothetical protein NEOC65_002294 [Neochlamydia sp. AcF65]|nr:hypothetical protein [Neochlamydia sp. AcF65]